MGRGGKRPNAGRKRGSSGATNILLKEAIIEAAAAVGDGGKKKGLVAYLTERAKDQPVAFMGLIGRVVPLQVEGTGEDGRIIIQTVNYADNNASS